MQWNGPHTYGFRHHLDSTPFTLWDHSLSNFRNLTPSGFSWILDQYNATSIYNEEPTITIKTDSPPQKPPLTIAALDAFFVPVDSPHPVTQQPQLDSTTNYMAIRNGLSDPLSHRFEKWVRPSDTQLHDVVDALEAFGCNLRAVTILCPHIIVEL